MSLYGTFVVSRASLNNTREEATTPPCEGARRETLTWKGCLFMEERKEDMWVVDINSEEELEKFINKHGRVVIAKYTTLTTQPWYIEIYDDYRE